MAAFFLRYKTPLACALALLGAAALAVASPMRVNYGVAAAVVLCACIAVAGACALRWAFAGISMRLLLFSAVFGVLLALALCVGTDIYTTYHYALTIPNLLNTAGLTLAMTPLLSAIFAWLIAHIPRGNEKLRGTRLERSRLNPANGGARAFFAIWALLALCWLPAYLGYFPGIYGYDMHSQNHQALSHLYNTYQPVLHTLLYEACYKLGLAVFGSGTGGVAVFSAVQSLLLSASLAGACTYIAQRLRAPAVVTLLAVAFCALLPVHPVMGVSSTKDTVFAAVFLMLLLQFYDLTMEPEAFLHSWKRWALFAATTLTACLLRNNMLYAFAFAAAFLILGVKTKRARVAALALFALALGAFGGRALNRAVRAGAGPRIEYLSVPIQQLAAAHDRNSERMDEAQKAVIYEYLPEALLDEYYPLLSDPIKQEAPIGNGLPAITGFLKVWAANLFPYLNDYMDSFLTMTLGYWYPGETLHAHIYDCYDEPDTEETLGYMYTGFMESINEDVHKRSLWPAAERYFQWFMHENGHQRIPVLSALFSPGLYCWLLFAALLTLLYYKRTELVWPLALLYGVWLTLLLGPCTIIRYAYPIMASAPVLAGLLFNASPRHQLCPPEDGGGSGEDSRGKEMLRFAVAGGVGFVIDYGCMILLVKVFGMHYLLATALAFLLSVIVNYLMCAYWVFKGADTKSRGVQAGFILTSLIGLGLNEVFMLLFVDVLHIHYAIAKLIAVALVMIWNYISKRRVLVRQKKAG